MKPAPVVKSQFKPPFSGQRSSLKLVDRNDLQCASAVPSAGGLPVSGTAPRAVQLRQPADLPLQGFASAGSSGPVDIQDWSSVRLRPFLRRPTIETESNLFSVYLPESVLKSLTKVFFRS